MTMTAHLWMVIQMMVADVNRRSGRLVGDRGEGVISTAIAVLIIAFIGAAMWAAFNGVWSGAKTNIETEVGKIGN